MTNTRTGDETIPLSSVSPLTEERYRAFIANSAEGIWRFEAEEPIALGLSEEAQVESFYRVGYLAECNDAFARMYGFALADELTGARLQDLVPQEDPTNQAYLQAFIRSGYRLVDAESVERDRNGDIRYVSNSLIGVVKDGHLIRAWGTQRDVTAQRRNEIALRESESRFRVMADCAPVMIWTSDVSAKCDWFNKPWLDFTGRTMTQQVEEGWEKGVHPDDVVSCRNTYRAAFAAREPFTMQYRLQCNNGEYRWVLDNGTPRYNEGEHSFVGFIGSCIDITQQKSSEDRLLAAIAEKERLTQTQAELLAQQRAFLKDVLLAATDGVLCLCDDVSELPDPLPIIEDFPGTEAAMPISAPALRAFRQRVDAIAAACGLPKERRYDLLTAVGEAAMNVVVHVQQGVGSGEVRGDVRRGRVQVWVTDSGPGIPVHRIHRAVLERGFTTAGSLGHGFFLLLKTADRAYLLTHEGSGTTMVLEKDRISPEPDWLNRQSL
ncbi:MAG: PAS domain S-box protein [Akkermansiaceae bacterium]|nr:PAS domain S-box protein [Armatimonadota bacterium]